PAPPACGATPSPNGCARGPWPGCGPDSSHPVTFVGRAVERPLIQSVRPSESVPDGGAGDQSKLWGESGSSVIQITEIQSEIFLDGLPKSLMRAHFDRGRRWFDPAPLHLNR